jgi:NAD-dependent histone deacetylase SIR2
LENLSGPETPCPGCTKISDDRKAEGKRATAIGKLRPDIVLYDEQDPLRSARPDEGL